MAPDPFEGNHRQPRAVYKYWAPRTLADVVWWWLGCSWLMQRKFQQSKVFLFIDRLVVSVVSETGTPQCFQQDREDSIGAMAQTVQKIVELPQVQLLRSCGRLCAHAETISRVSRQVVIVASRATDHGGIVKVHSFYELEQIVASRATDHGRNR